MEENAKDIWDLAHVIVSKVSWFTEAARDNAHELIEKMNPNSPAPASQDAKAGSDEDPGEDFTASKLDNLADSHAEPVDPSDSGG
jgi:hypothetical protein